MIGMDKLARHRDVPECVCPDCQKKRKRERFERDVERAASEAILESMN